MMCDEDSLYPKRRSNVSSVWDYFTINPMDRTKAICKQCSVQVTRGKSSKDFSTSNLLNHLKRHKELYEEMLMKRQERSMVMQQNYVTLNEYDFPPISQQPTMVNTEEDHQRQQAAVFDRIFIKGDPASTGSSAPTTTFRVKRARKDKDPSKSSAADSTKSDEIFSINEEVKTILRHANDSRASHHHHTSNRISQQFQQQQTSAADAALEKDESSSSYFANEDEEEKLRTYLASATAMAMFPQPADITTDPNKQLHFTDLKQQLNFTDPKQLTFAAALRQFQSMTNNYLPQTHLFQSMPNLYNKQKVMECALVKWICDQLQPFDIVKNDSFKNLLHIADPYFDVPSMEKVKREILPKIYENARQIVRSLLDQSQWVSCSLNFGPVPNCRRRLVVLNFAVHYIAPDWQRRRFTLSSASFSINQEQSQPLIDNLSERLIRLVSDWSLSSKLNAILIDDWSTTTMLQQTLEEREIPWIPSVTFVLHRIINDTVNTHRPINELINIALNTANYLKKNLLLLQQQTSKYDDQDVIQRVEHHMTNSSRDSINYTYLYPLLELLSKQSEFFKQALLDDPELGHQINNDSVEMMTFADQWNVLKCVLRVMKPFHAAFKLIERDEATISEVIPLFRKVKMELQRMTPLDDSDVQAFLNSLVTSLDQQFYPEDCSFGVPPTYSIEQDFTFAKATLLDPRFKDKKFCDACLCDEAKKALINELQESNNGSVIFSSAEYDTNAISTATASKKLRTDESLAPCCSKTVDFWHHFAYSDEEDSLGKFDSPKKSAAQIFSEYLASPLLNINECPLTWWKSYQRRFPDLGRLAMKYLSCPPGSTTANTLNNPKSNNGILDDVIDEDSEDIVEKTLFLHNNLNSINFTS